MKRNGSHIIGLVATILIHVALGLLLLSSGLHNAPPPSFSGMEVEFLPEPPRPIVPPQVVVEHSTEARTPKPEPEKEPELVQQAKAPEVIEGTQRTQESQLGTEGDVEKAEPEPPVIDERSLFRSRDKDTTAAEQTAAIADKKPQAGHADGNTLVGKTDGAPVAHLEGRTVVGQLPRPEYTENTSGKVVVRIRVDNYGKVTSATPGISGTTVQNRTLWNAAQKAALQARFNVSGNAPPVQEGTITYIFKLN